MTEADCSKCKKRDICSFTKCNDCAKVICYDYEPEDET